MFSFFNEQDEARKEFHDHVHHIIDASCGIKLYTCYLNGYVNITGDDVPLVQPLDIGKVITKASHNEGCEEVNDKLMECLECKS